MHHHLVREVREVACQADVADHGRHRRHRAPDVRRQRGQAARVDRHHHVVGVQLAVGGPDGRHPSVAHDEVECLGPGQDRDAAQLEPRGHRGAERGEATGDRPGAEALLEVDVDAGVHRGVAQLVAGHDQSVPGDEPQPLVAERLAQPLVQRLAPSEQVDQLARRDVGVEGPLEPLLAQQLPRLAVRRHVVDPLLPQARTQALEGRELGGSGTAGDPDRRSVAEAVLADRVERLQVELALQGAARLAEQVADHGGEQGARGTGVPREAVVLDRGQGAAEVVGALQEGDVVAQLGQTCGRCHAAEPATDHHHACHG